MGRGERGIARFPQLHTPPGAQAHISLCIHARAGQGDVLPCSVAVPSIQKSTP